MYRPGQPNQQRQSQQGQSQGRESFDGSPRISGAAALAFPLEAVIDETGEPVTLLQTCDWQGHSPSNIGVDRNGKQFIAAFSEVTVTDHRAVPNPQATMIRQRQTNGDRLALGNQ